MTTTTMMTMMIVMTAARVSCSYPGETCRAQLTRIDIAEIMRACGFSSASYDSAATSSIQDITVSATRPTDISQLTTTVNSQQTGGLGNDDSGSNGGGGNQDNDNNGGDGNQDNGDDDSGAMQALPGMAAFAAGAAVAGAMLLQ